MSDTEAKIERWRRYIDECRKEAKLLSHEGRQAMQLVIDGYEQLIAMALAKDKPTVGGLGMAMLRLLMPVSWLPPSAASTEPAVASASLREPGRVLPRQLSVLLG
jgi:hypothetical protein